MDKIKRTSLLLSGFIGGIAFIVGCNELDLNSALALGSQEQMICQKGYWRDYVNYENDDFYTDRYFPNASELNFDYFFGNSYTSGQGSEHEVLKTYGVVCASVSEAISLPVQPLQNFTTSGWIIASETTDGYLLSRYSD